MLMASCFQYNTEIVKVNDNNVLRPINIFDVPHFLSKPLAKPAGFLEADTAQEAPRVPEPSSAASTNTLRSVSTAAFYTREPGEIPHAPSVKKASLQTSPFWPEALAKKPKTSVLPEPIAAKNISLLRKLYDVGRLFHAPVFVGLLQAQINHQEQNKLYHQIMFSENAETTKYLQYIQAEPSVWKMNKVEKAKKIWGKDISQLSFREDLLAGWDPSVAIQLLLRGGNLNNLSFIAEQEEEEELIKATIDFCAHYGVQLTDEALPFLSFFRRKLTSYLLHLHNALNKSIIPTKRFVDCGASDGSGDFNTCGLNATCWKYVQLGHMSVPLRKHVSQGLLTYSLLWDLGNPFLDRQGARKLYERGTCWIAPLVQESSAVTLDFCKQDWLSHVAGMMRQNSMVLSRNTASEGYPFTFCFLCSSPYFSLNVIKNFQEGHFQTVYFGAGALPSTSLRFPPLSRPDGLSPAPFVFKELSQFIIKGKEFTALSSEKTGKFKDVFK
jgi:hypothetical protein